MGKFFAFLGTLFSLNCFPGDLDLSNCRDSYKIIGQWNTVKLLSEHYQVDELFENLITEARGLCGPT